MTEYSIEITETLQTVVYIEADNLEDALSMTREQYRNGDIVLDADNSNVDYDIKHFKES